MRVLATSTAPFHLLSQSCIATHLPCSACPPVVLVLVLVLVLCVVLCCEYRLVSRDMFPITDELLLQRA